MIYKILIASIYFGLTFHNPSSAQTTASEIPYTNYSEIYYSTERPDSSYVIQRIPPGYPGAKEYVDSIYIGSAHSADSLYDLIKSRYMGKKFVFDPRILFSDSKCKQSDKSPTTGLVWTVTDVRRLAYDKTSNLDIPRPLAYERLVCKSTNGDCAMVDLIYFSGQKRDLVFTPEKAAKLKAKYGTTFWNAILGGSAKLGMTKDMCTLAWGNPSDSTITQSTNGTLEKWIYYFPSHAPYIYFTNGLLTAYEN